MAYDVLIIGSGLSGLQCGYILSKEGFRVCVVEKQRVLGGCLQTFSRCGSVFDTGMHYIGAMDDGQVTHSFFKYFGLNRKLRLKRMDEEGYDIVRYKGKEYPFAMGYSLFRDTMLRQFPGEKEALDKYITMLKEIKKSVDIYNLRDFTGTNTEYFRFFGIGLADYLDSITSDDTLKNVLVGLAPLYAGVRDRTPLYVHMMIHSSYIEGAYRFVDGGSQIARHLEESILGHGGSIFRNAEVTRLITSNNRIIAAEINHQDILESDYVVASIHPKTVINLLAEGDLKPAYRHRIFSTEETYGMFSLYLVMKARSFRYINHNYYSYQIGDIWSAIRYTEESWPGGFMIHFSPVSGDPEYTNAIIVNTIMRWDEMLPWVNTHVENRGEAYHEFKQKKGEKVLELLEREFPGIRSGIKHWYSSSPLTYRDYTGTWEGSVYGIQKDFRDPMRTMVLPRTRIQNLMLTGQNTNIHGVVGVTIGSFLTCSELLGKNYLIDKIRNAG